jgi:Ankyrin repeat.
MASEAERAAEKTEAEIRAALARQTEAAARLREASLSPPPSMALQGWTPLWLKENAHAVDALSAVSHAMDALSVRERQLDAAWDECASATGSAFGAAVARWLADASLHEDDGRSALAACADMDGCTLLHLAASRGDMPAVEELISHGAPLYTHNRLGRIAADEARRAGHVELLPRMLATSPRLLRFNLSTPI